ncbi:MAG: eukaryotic-like serine/threonine-protein kinase, partial [Thermoleophilaceae bacterium]|nr:eukaryotic-like serine/threonine-protein kinase [Thermoleophilaceae bacterium]
AARLQGHFRERHYEPVRDVSSERRPAVGDRPLSWWAVKRVSEYSGRINLWLAGGFGLLYALYIVAADHWPGWMGRHVFQMCDQAGGAAALAAALIVAALPRLGWLAVATAFAAWLGFELRDGTALVVGIALLAVPILLPRAGRLWSLAVLAPLLGVVALGPAFVALAGMASTAARRAGLAAAGFAWLAFAELLTSDRLLFGPPVDATPRAAWARSLGSAGRDAVLPLIGSPVVVGALAWAILAALLPYLVSGRSMALDVAGALVWGAALVAALAGVANLAGHHIGSADPRGALLGTLLGAFAAVGARATGLWHDDRGPAPVP